jgi:hypothetical protein
MPEFLTSGIYQIWPMSFLEGNAFFVLLLKTIDNKTLKMAESSDEKNLGSLIIP